MSKDDGGPAYPISVHPEHGFGPAASVHEGMSLRDWFAGRVDIPWNAAIATLELDGKENPTVGQIATARAQMRYLEADAMLKARQS